MTKKNMKRQLHSFLRWTGNATALESQADDADDLESVEETLEEEAERQLQAVTDDSDDRLFAILSADPITDESNNSKAAIEMRMSRRLAQRLSERNVAAAAADSQGGGRGSGRGGKGGARIYPGTGLTSSGGSAPALAASSERRMKMIDASENARVKFGQDQIRYFKQDEKYKSARAQFKKKSSSRQSFD